MKTTYTKYHHPDPHLMPAIERTYLLPIKRFKSTVLKKIPAQISSFLHCRRWLPVLHRMRSASFYSFSAMSCSRA